MNTDTQKQDGGAVASKDGFGGFPPYAYSHETPSRPLWDADDMRDYAAYVLKDANELCRSAMEIAKRDGRDTNWETFRARLQESLLRQHAVMYPPNADRSDGA
jgi:hypothetical protein